MNRRNFLRLSGLAAAAPAAVAAAESFPKALIKLAPADPIVIRAESGPEIMFSVGPHTGTELKKFTDDPQHDYYDYGDDN